jgi:hypothetical protein
MIRTGGKILSLLNAECTVWAKWVFWNFKKKPGFEFRNYSFLGI